MSHQFNPIGLYTFLKPFLFLLPPETAHKLSLYSLHWAGSFTVGRNLIQSMIAPPLDPTSIFGQQVPNRIGMAAGYDKNALALRGLEAMGFGHIEVGTITPQPQPGNPAPRLHRNPKNHTLVNRLGFPSEGMEIVAKRLEHYRNHSANKPHKVARPLLGINIGKNKETPNDQAFLDYLSCFRRLVDFADYIAINISSPNTPNLRDLQQKEALEQLITPLLDERAKREQHTPLMVKLSPDMHDDQCLECVLQLSKLDIEGVILSNTRRTTSPWSGGLSGVALHESTLNRVEMIKKEIPHMKIIASGGIGLDHDVDRFRRAGADLIQIWTALIYRGPKIMRAL